MWTKNITKLAFKCWNFLYNVFFYSKYRMGLKFSNCELQMLCVMNCKKINKCIGNQQCNRHLYFPSQHYSFQGFFQTFPYLLPFSRLFKALKISTLNYGTFRTFRGSVWTLCSGENQGGQCLRKPKRYRNLKMIREKLRKMCVCLWCVTALALNKPNLIMISVNLECGRYKHIGKKWGIYICISNAIGSIDMDWATSNSRGEVYEFNGHCRQATLKNCKSSLLLGQLLVYVIFFSFGVSFCMTRVFLR